MAVAILQTVVIISKNIMSQIDQMLSFKKPIVSYYHPISKNYLLHNINSKRRGFILKILEIVWTLQVMSFYGIQNRKLVI